jgi:4-aminobutyrate aminotransferase-like enzyme
MRLQEKAREAGLLISAEGESLLLLPALNIEMKVAREGLDILERCIVEVSSG